MNNTEIPETGTDTTLIGKNYLDLLKSKSLANEYFFEVLVDEYETYGQVMTSEMYAFIHNLLPNKDNYLNWNFAEFQNAVQDYLHSCPDF